MTETKDKSDLWVKPAADIVPAPDCLLKPLIPFPGYDVFFLSINNWDFRFQRPQHIATRLAMFGHRVFYVSIDFKAGSFIKTRDIAPSIIEVFLPYIKDCKGYNEDLNAGIKSLETGIEDLVSAFEIKESIVLVEFPSWLPLAKHLKEKYDSKIVFDILDDFTGFSNVGSHVGQIQNELLSIADLAVCTAQRIYDKVLAHNKKTILIRNGTEFCHFNKLPIENRLKEFRKPIIGYYGAIADWFDTDIIQYAAEKHPEWSFVLIGHTFFSDTDKLKTFNNVFFFGEKSYSELPLYYCGFDVCIIPFKINELTLSTNPVKFYEYISSGKPVVSSDLPELQQYKDLAYLSKGPEEFLSNLEKAVTENSHELRQKRIEVARHNDWNGRLADLEKSIRPIFPLASIVVITCNNLQINRLCLESIRRKTGYPNYEIIVVDNASTDGTREYLTDLQHSEPRLRLIFNDTNRGFSKGSNQGIKAALGEFIILLKNDTVVTRGWLGGLLRHLRNPAIGMVGPVTNNTDNEAKIKISYASLDEMDSFANEYTSSNFSRNFPIPVLSMFCIALPKGVFDRVGFLDEQYELGMFVDEDFAIRVMKAGFRIRCAEDVFIHHWGNSSFMKGNLDSSNTPFNRNKDYFEKKWGRAYIPHKYRHGVD